MATGPDAHARLLPAAITLRATPRGRLWLIAALLALIFAGISIASPAFASPANIRDILVNISPVIIVACGMTILIISGEIDVSVGSLLGLLGALMGLCSSPTHANLPLAAVIAITLAAGAALGLLNGLLVVLGRVPSIITTLGAMTILRGATELLMAGSWITDLPASLRYLGTGTPLGIPVCLWAALIAVILSLLFLRATRPGLWTYAVGGNLHAAHLARVPTHTTRLLAFTLLGLLTGLAALVSIPQQSVIESGIGVGFELSVITAVVVGGASIRGGSGGILGTLLAAILLGSVRTGLIFINLGDSAVYWERAIQGAFILAAVLSDVLTRQDSARQTA
ncbi:MAG TPA: ABC transporter permease [Phycisphaerales bacterium]|nr:ABC transporter permease [Phycisphaerales bacterium]